MNKLLSADDKPIYLHKEPSGLDCAARQRNGSRKHGPAHSFLSYPQVRHQEAKINVRFCLLFKKKNTNLSHRACEVSTVLILPATPPGQYR